MGELCRFCYQPAKFWHENELDQVIGICGGHMRTIRDQCPPPSSRGGWHITKPIRPIDGSEKPECKYFDVIANIRACEAPLPMGAIASYSKPCKHVTKRQLLDEIERLRAGIHEAREGLLYPSGSWDEVVGDAIEKLGVLEGEVE